MRQTAKRTLVLAILAAAAPAQAINFTRTDWPSSLKAADAAAGDVDGDGVLDLAAVGPLTTRVSVLLGTGGGGFAPFALVPGIGAGPVSIVAGDLDGDGIDDLAIACRDSDQVWTLAGVAGGLPAVSSVQAVGDAPQWIVAADFDLDGDLDLATPNAASDDASILLGDGAGGFAPASSIVWSSPGVTEPMMTVTDCHADGDPDLVAASTTFGVRILHGDGTGSFVPTFAPSTGQTLWVSAADIDGDLLPDLLTRDWTGLDDDLSILQGNAAGTFTFQGWILQSMYAGELVDMTGEGVVDMLALFSGGPGPYGPRIGMRPGTGSLFGFQTEQRFQAAKTPSTLITADLDADGRRDAVVSYGNAAAVISAYVASNPAPPTISAVSPSGVSTLGASYEGQTLAVTGSGFTSLTSVMLGTYSIGTAPGYPPVTSGDTGFTVQVGYNPVLVPVGPTTVTVTNSFGSASFPVSIVAPAVPTALLESTSFGSTAKLYLAWTPAALTYLGASTDLLPSSLPGLVDLGIGNGFASLVYLGAGAIPPAAWTQKVIGVAGVPAGTTIHFQFAALDPAAPAFPLAVSNVVTGTKQ